MNRDTAIKEIRTALKARTGRAWSVKGGQGTAWGWIEINTTPAREKEGYGNEDRKELYDLMGKTSKYYGNAIDVPASEAHYSEYILRAKGEPATVTPAYWD